MKLVQRVSRNSTTKSKWRACNQLYKHAISAAGKPIYSPDNLAEFRQELDRRKAEIASFKNAVVSTLPADKVELRNRAPSFLFLLWVAPVEPLMDANYRAAAQLAATQMLLALRRYEIAHGRLPDDLQTAAAESVLKAVPIDPFDGNPLRWAIVAGMPTVYSVGKDRKDDGGQADWQFGKQPGDYLFLLPAKTP